MRSLLDFINSTVYAHMYDAGMVVFLDVIGSQPFAMAKVLTDMVAEFPDLHEWAVVCSFYPQTLLSVKYYLPQFATILTHR